MGFDRNPMRRGTDRIQAIVRAVLLAVFVLGGPAVTAYVGHEVSAAGLRAGRAQAAAWHRAPAVVLHVTQIATVWRHAPAAGGPSLLSVRWTTPEGWPRTGQIASGGHAAAGSIVMVWIDASSRLAHAPLTHADVVARVIGAAIITPVVLALVLWVASWVVSRVLDRHRLACWEAGWLMVEPRWTKRR
jgi:hypothetical protein